MTGNFDLYLLSGYCFKNDSTLATRANLLRAFAFVLLFGRIGAQAKPLNKIWVRRMVFYCIITSEFRFKSVNRWLANISRPKISAQETNRRKNQSLFFSILFFLFLFIGAKTGRTATIKMLIPKKISKTILKYLFKGTVRNIIIGPLFVGAIIINIFFCNIIINWLLFVFKLIIAHLIIY